MYMLVAMIAGAVLAILLTAVFVHRAYKKRLTAADWYDDFYYEYESTGCPHTKRVQLSDTDWKFAFRMKKEKHFTVRAGPVAHTAYQEQTRLFCDECGKKRWFRQTNSVQDHKPLFYLRLKYMLIGAGAIMFIIFVFLYSFFGIVFPRYIS